VNALRLARAADALAPFARSRNKALRGTARRAIERLTEEA
jgi:hypothetical protein